MWIPLSLAFLGCAEDPPCRPDIHAWEDQDGDGFGSVEVGLVCDLAAGQVEQGMDCDDANTEIGPEARERCNQVDDDCDGEIDEDLRLVQYWQDTDGDGFGGLFPSQLSCERPGPDWYKVSDDCDDMDPVVSPAGQEVCGGGDEDCDGVVDELDDSIDPSSFLDYFRDADGDGSGDPERSRQGCHLAIGYVANADDCDDADPTFEFLELYDDADGDGYGDPTSPTTGCLRDEGKALNGDDCDDTDPDLLDERDWYVDEDGDGYGSGPSQGFGCLAPRPDLVGFGGDCNEDDVAFNPGVPEQCRDDIDQNCDLLVDCEDPQCDGSPACQPACADDTLTDPLPISVNGSTAGAGDQATPTTCGFSQAPELVYWWVPPQTRQYQIDTAGSVFDTILYVRESCGGREIACNDDGGGAFGLDSVVYVNLTAGVGVLIHVDGYSSGNGAFVLNIQ